MERTKKLVCAGSGALSVEVEIGRVLGRRGGIDGVEASVCGSVSVLAMVAFVVKGKNGGPVRG